MTRQQLIEQIYIKKSVLCIGIDPDIDKLPNHFPKNLHGAVDFCHQIIESTQEHCVAYKPNFAFFEAMGRSGYDALFDIKQAIPKHIFSIADAKRGDIGNTSKMYAQAILGDMDFDAITVAPYMGSDSIKPFLDFEDKFVIVLGLTSNAGSKDFQKVKLSDGSMLYEKVMRTAAEWANPDQLMFVVGATHSEEIAHVRQIIPEHFFLVPGVGAQGGSATDVMTYGKNKEIGVLINSSRGILYAHNGLDFAVHASKAAELLNEETLNYIK